MKVQFQGELTDDQMLVEITARDEALVLTLTDRANQRTWGPAPLLALEVHDKALRREDRLERYRIDGVHSTDRGLHIVVGDTMRGITVGLWLRLRGGELSVLYSSTETYEVDPHRYRLFAIDLLPALLRVTGGHGRLLVPINGATLCQPADKPAAADRFMIYMEQPRWELTSLLPIAAAWDQRGGLMTLAAQAAPEAQCRVATDGRGGGQVGWAFCLRQNWADPVEAALREFRFVAIPAAQEPVHFVAKRLRRHVLEDLKKPTLKERAAESPEVAYQLRTMTIKLFHGIQNLGPCISDTQGLPPSHFINAMTFAEAAEALRRLRAAGVDRLYTQSVGWNARGHDGLYPTRFPIEQRVGGEEGFRALVRVAHELGYQPQVHDNYQMNIPHAPDWDEECIIQDVYGEPLLHGWWAGGPEYATWPAALPESRVGGHLRRLKDLGLCGMGYCDYWITPLEVNYHPRHRGTRSAHQRGIDDVLGQVRRAFGAVGAELGTLPGAVACDSVGSLPHQFDRTVRNHPDWPIAGLLGEAVPVWALALHGLVLHQAPCGAGWSNAMAAIVWGSILRDECGVRAIPVGGINRFDEQRVTATKAIYDLCCGPLARLVTEEMTRCVLSPDGMQVQSVFADGTEVSADFSTEELHINGKRVDRPAALH